MTVNVDIDMTITEPSEIDMAVTQSADTVDFELGAEAIPIKNHAVLENRDMADQHPISAITGLADKLSTIPTKTSQLQNDSGFITSSAIPTVPTKTSQLTNDSGFITSAQVPVQSVNGRTGAVTGLAEASAIPTKVSDLTNDSGYVTHDNETEQSYISDPTSYSYWRGLMIGATAVASESGTFSTTTDKVYVADSIRVQPSTGTIKATTFKGNLTGTASGNLIASDLVAITNAEIDAIVV